MSFKKRLTAMCLVVGFVIIATTVTLVAIFANGNLLVKTNVSVTYTGITLDSAYVATNSWRVGDEEKIENLALTKAEEATVASEITHELTAENDYVVYEFVLKNMSDRHNYYFQTTYTDDTTADRNMFVQYCSSVDEPIAIEEIYANKPEEIKGYYWGGTTRLSNNITAEPGHTVYAYVIVGVDDMYYESAFSGSFVCNISMEKFSTESQDWSVYYGPVNGYYTTGSIFYIKMGEMPQDYAGTDDSLYTLTEEVYTEFGVDYPIYRDNRWERYAKRDGKYYKIDPIIWQVLGEYNSLQQYSMQSRYFNVYGATNFSLRVRSNLTVIPTKILFYSEWNSSLTRVNYPNSTIYSKLMEFYNDVLSEYDSKILAKNVSYNKAETETQSSCTDYSEGYGTLSSQKICLFTYSQAYGWGIASSLTFNSRKVNTTPWVSNSESTAYVNWWMRTNQYNNTDGEIFKARYYNVDGTSTTADITEVMGVRPAMVVTL